MIEIPFAEDNRVQVRVEPNLLTWLKARAERMHTASHHQQASAELNMWRDVLAEEQRRLRFTYSELCCIADVLNGTLIDPAVGTSVPIAYASLYDEFRYYPGSYGDRWEIDERALLAKVGDLSPAADAALRDGIARWWEDTTHSDTASFERVGFRLPTPRDKTAPTQADS